MELTRTLWSSRTRNKPGSTKVHLRRYGRSGLGREYLEIRTPNNWIGMGTGEDRLIGWNSDVLAFYEGAWQDGQVRFKFEGIKYPNDCEPKPGVSFKPGNGVYEPKYKWLNSAFKLEWTGRNIAPDVP